jgi:hypothetical protein
MGADKQAESTSPHAAKRFVGLAIIVRGKDRVALASSSFVMNT